MINERIKDLRKTIELSQAEFGKRLGVTRSVILNIELNKVTPKEVFVEHICDVFNVNRDWLLCGTGDIFCDEAYPHKAMEELWFLYQKLKPDFQEYVIRQIKQLLELQNTKTDA